MSELFNAITRWNTARALQIIESGQYDPDELNKHGYTALMWACFLKMPDIAMGLIATGQSNPTYRCNMALTYAKLNNMTAVIDALENYDNYMASLQQHTQLNPYDDPNYVMTIDI